MRPVSYMHEEYENVYLTCKHTLLLITYLRWNVAYIYVYTLAKTSNDKLKRTNLDTTKEI